jgi:hypothetical protein
MTRFGGTRPAARRGVARRGAWRGFVIAGSLLLTGVVPTSSAVAISGDVVVQVRVSDAAGAPVAGAAVLTTVLWTSRSDFRRYGHPRGQLLRADGRGELSVSIALDRRQRAAVRRNGDWANISVVALDAAGRAGSFATTSRYLGTRPEKRAQERTMAHADVVRLVQPRSTATTRAPQAGAAMAIADCPYYYWDVDSYWNRFAQVGELHADFDVPHARFTYGQTADTTFDVMSKTGTESWSVSSGVHIENTRGAAVYADSAGTTNYHWALRSQFRFVNMKLFKDCVGGPYRVSTGSQLVYALEWTGNGMTLSNTLTQPARTSANSAPYGPHTGWTRTSGSLVRWQAAVSVLGASISAQSGSSTSVKIEYSFGGRPTHYLYGDTGLPTVSRRVFQDTP